MLSDRPPEVTNHNPVIVCETVSSSVVNSEPMGLLNRAIKHYQVYGIYNLLGATSTELFDQDVITPFLFPVWYKGKTLFNPWFEYNGVSVTLEHAAISPAIKREFMLGYETTEMKLIEDNMKHSSNVIELGGGLGVVSCYIDKNVDTKGTQITVEANPELESILEAHKKRNQASFDIIQKAYSPTDDSASFHVHDDVFSSGTQSRKRVYDDSVSVPTTDLQTLCDDFALDEFDLVADIEGEEHSLFREEIELLKQQCRLLIVEIHDTEDATVVDGQKQLEENGFTQTDRMSNVFVFENSSVDKV